MKDKKIGFLERTSMYGFELFMALFGLVTSLIVVDYGIFALCNYARGVDKVGDFMGQITLWVVAAMVVWLPVTIIFYLRARNEADRQPARTQSPLYKVLLSIYYFTIIVGAVGLVFAAVFSLIQLIVNPDASVSDSVLGVIIPALLAAGVHVGMMFAFRRAGMPTKQQFAWVFGGFAAIVAVVLFIVSAGYIRGSEIDNTSVTDLNTLQSSIYTYYSEKKSVPDTLSQVTLPSVEITNRLSRYTYTKVDQLRYTLCVTFETDTTNRLSTGEVTPVVGLTGTNDEYSTYAPFYVHKKGYTCYKLKAFDATSSNVKPL